MQFRYNVDGKEMDSWLGYSLEFACFPCVCAGLLQELWFASTSQTCARDVMGVSQLSRSEWVWVPSCERVPCPVLGPTLCPELLGEAPAALEPELE